MARQIGDPEGCIHAYRVKYTQDNVTLLFFLDFSPATSARRRNLNPVLRRMTALGLQPFLIYPAIIKLRHNDEQMMFDYSQKAEDFISSLPQKKHLNCPGEENNLEDMDT